MQKTTLSATRFQENRIRQLKNQSDSFDFFNVLTSDKLLSDLEALLPEHRERLYPPAETLSMFLAQVMNADRSCQNVVNQSAAKRLVGNLPVCSTYTGGYCRARQRLPLSLMRELTQRISALVEEQVPEEWLWKNRKVKIVDGTTVTLPDTAANQSEYPQQGSQKEGLGFPIARVVGVTSLSSGMLINAAIGPYKGKGGDERMLLRSIQDTFSAGDLVLADALYATYFFIADMQRKGVDILMEQNGSRRLKTDFRRGKKLGMRDHIIEITKPKRRPYWMSEVEYELAPATIMLREFKAKKKVLVTTISSPTAALKAELALLYKSRWQVELDIRNIKETLGMNTLSCKTPDMALKEIWVYLLAYNLIRLLMAQSALIFDVLPRNFSFKHCLQLWTAISRSVGYLHSTQLNGLFHLMAQQQVGNRPGRVEPRAVKRRPKAYALLTDPRGIARKKIQKNGPEKKLK